SSIDILASGVSLGSWPARTARGGLSKTRDGMLDFGLLVRDVSAVRYGQISKLKSRVNWLESIIKDRCPDVDLFQELALDNGFDAVDGQDSTIRVEALSPTPGAVAEPVTQPSNLPARGPTEQPAHTNGLLSHEIGLVSLNSSQDPRYIGPSSGHFLARLMLAPGRREATSLNAGRLSPPRGSALPLALVESLQGPLPLPSMEQATILSNAYFDMLHPQYPILHRPTFMANLARAYDSPAISRSSSSFQIFMVLALGATTISQQHKVRLPAESYCLSALEHFDYLNIDNSLQGLQSLLLLLIFTLHCPNTRLNVWYLNYQCIAAVLDLGLQRNITTSSGITKLQQHLRTRMFWVVMMLDRQIATMMGRPIGLRDEACDLRLPDDVDDNLLGVPGGQGSGNMPSTTSALSFSIHLFKLTKLNSEIKYVANSVVRDAPRYAYPAVVDINEWHTNMLHQLDQWSTDTSAIDEALQDVSTRFMSKVCRSRYLNLKMVLLRPSPAIPNPSPQSLTLCHGAALESLNLYSQMYRDNQLLHSWQSFYSVVLSSITFLYCIKAESELARTWAAKPDALLIELSKGLNVLGATGEHWAGAKRCRDMLEELGRGLATSLRNKDGDGRAEARRTNGSLSGVFVEAPSLPAAPSEPPNSVSNGTTSFSAMDSSVMPGYADFGSNFSDLLTAEGLFGDDSFLGDPGDLDAAMRSLFDDFIPTYPTAS
ncbi:hypothetical protein BN1708_010190, partial [Verticillium longisporum]